MTFSFQNPFIFAIANQSEKQIFLQNRQPWFMLPIPLENTVQNFLLQKK